MVEELKIEDKVSEKALSIIRKMSKAPRAYIYVLLYCLEHYLRKGEKEKARETEEEVLRYGWLFDRILGTEEYEKYAEKKVAELIR